MNNKLKIASAVALSSLALYTFFHQHQAGNCFLCRNTGKVLTATVITALVLGIFAYRDTSWFRNKDKKG